MDNLKLNQLYTKYTHKEISAALVLTYLNKKHLDYSSSKIICDFIKDSYLSQDILSDVSTINTNSIFDLSSYFEVLVDSKTQEQHGAWFTPPSIVKQMVQTANPSFLDKILDPCVGCGAFTIGLLDHFESLSKNIKDTLKENIYAFDLQEESLFRAKTLISIYALEKSVILSYDDFNFKCANTLLVNWKKEFSVDFNLVIGNPPYISSERGEFQALLPTYKKYFNTIYKVYDTFGLFIEKSFTELPSNSKICFITPTTLYVNDSFVKLRELILQHKIHFISDLGDKVFDNAVVPTGFYVFEKNGTINNTTVLFKNTKNTISQNLLCNKNKIFNLSQNNIISSFLDSISNIKHDKLSTLVTIREALKTGNDKVCIQKTQSKDFNTPLLKGKHINRFKINDSNYINLNTAKNIREITLTGLLNPHKLLIRRVSNEIICAYDKSSTLAVHTLYFAILKDIYKSYPNLLLVLELILNSPLYTDIYLHLCPLKGDLFPEIRIGALNDLPIPNISTLINHQEDILNFRDEYINNTKSNLELNLFIQKLFTI